MRFGGGLVEHSDPFRIRSERLALFHADHPQGVDHGSVAFQPWFVLDQAI
jgi:hypothetical protein